MRAAWRPERHHETAPPERRAAWARSTFALLLLAQCGGGGEGGEVCPAHDVVVPAPLLVECTPYRDELPPDVSIAIPETLVGSNGVFTDFCAGCDTLVQHSCASRGRYVDGQDNVETDVTGEVLAGLVRCPCVEGRCVTGCPEVGDVMRVEAITPEAVTLSDDTTGKRYTCPPRMFCDLSPDFNEVIWVGGTGLCTEGRGAFGFAHCGFYYCTLLP